MKKFIGILFLIALAGAVIGGCWWFITSGANIIQEKLLAGLSENVTAVKSDNILTTDSGYSAIGVDANRAKDYFTPGAASSKKDVEKLYAKCSSIFETAEYEAEPTIIANLVVKSEDNKKMVITGKLSFDDAELSGIQFSWYTEETIFRSYPGGAFYPGKDKYLLKVKNLSISNESNLLIKVKKEDKEYFYDCAYAYASEDQPDNASKVAIQNICTHLYTDLFYVAELEPANEDENVRYYLDTDFLDRLISEPFNLENNGNPERAINNMYKNYYDVKYEDEGANDILGYMAIKYIFYSPSKAEFKNYYVLLHATEAVPGNDTMLVGVYDDKLNCIYYADETGLRYHNPDIEIKLGTFELNSSEMVFVKNVKNYGKYIGLYESTKFAIFGQFDLEDDFYYGINHGSDNNLFYKKGND